jgi:hypothetical protein
MFYQDLVEFKQFGFNAVTISALATVIFTLIEAYGLIRQNRIIRNKRSAKSIANPVFIYFAFMFAIMLVYGVARKEGTLIFNGCLFVCFIPIVLALYKFKGFFNTDILLFFVGAISLIAMIFLSMKEMEIIFTFFSFGSILILILQSREIWKQKSVGEVDPVLIATYIVSEIFWMIYAFKTNDLPLLLIVTLSFMALVSTAVLWVYFFSQKTAADI